MRQPDKPGTYRVVSDRLNPGKWMLSGVRWNGKRIKHRGLTRVEAEQSGMKIFGGGTPVVASSIPSVSTPLVGTSGDEPATPVDDWGYPIRVQADKVDAINAGFNIAPAPTAPKGPDPDDVAKRERRAANAKSLMELGGVTWALGSVWAGRKLCERTGREAPMPSKTQVADLQEVTKEALTDFFGSDVGLKPWQLMILLSIGIPFSMFLQDPEATAEGGRKESGGSEVGSLVTTTVREVLRELQKHTIDYQADNPLAAMRAYGRELMVRETDALTVEGLQQENRELRTYLYVLGGLLFLILMARR